MRFFAWLREEVGVDHLEVEVEDTNLHEVLLLLREIIGDRSMVIFDGEKLKSNIIIAVNNNIVHWERMGSISIKDGDVVDIMPFGSGG